MADDDFSRITEEIEVLGAIYGDQFHIHDDLNYTLDVDDGNEPSLHKLSIEFTFPSSGYPSSVSPTYNLLAPWLRGESRKRLIKNLDRISRENIGECMVHKWVERLKEFLEELTTGNKGSYRDSPEPVEDINQSNDELETNNDSYEFVPSGQASTFSPPLGDPELVNPNGRNVQLLPTIHHGEFIKDRKSVFQGHLAKVTHKDQVQLVMDSLKENKKIADATHNIIAYRIEYIKGAFITGCVDDGETHAGARMLHLLDIIDARDVLVVVTRWYGGVHLGTDRFKHINNITRILLEQHGFVRDKMADKKGTKSQKSQVSASGATESTDQSDGRRQGKKIKM